MKSLNQIKKEKQSLLGDIDFSQTGGMYLGANTSYMGPSNPSSLTTILDGLDLGRDPFSGSLAGDRWKIDSTWAEEQAMLYVWGK
ncbi:MAG: hypothetical protein PHW82_00865 [Bacteroidales bacterium]|nr:hypothetical protein [Bacteroidales bacterium]